MTVEGEETLVEQGRSLVAPLIFFIVIAFQFASSFLEHLKKVIHSHLTFNFFFQIHLSIYLFILDFKRIIIAKLFDLHNTGYIFNVAVLFFPLQIRKYYIIFIGIYSYMQFI